MSQLHYEVSDQRVNLLHFNLNVWQLRDHEYQLSHHVTVMYPWKHCEAI